MKDLLQGYEECEQLFMLTDKFIAYGENLIQEYCNLTALQKAVGMCRSDEALNIIASKFSLEADVQAAEDPTAASGGSTKPNSKPNKSKSAGLSSTIMDKSRGALEKLKDFMSRSSTWFKEFFTKSEKYAAQVVNSLATKAAELDKSGSNINYKVKGVCLTPQDVQLQPVLAQITGAKSKEDLSKVYETLQSTLAGKIPQEEQELTKDQVIDLLKSYAEANKRITSERQAASGFFEHTANTAAADKNNEALMLRQLQVTSAMNVVNYLVRFVFQNSAKLLSITAKGLVKNR
jgi:hypothetical protein